MASTLACEPHRGLLRVTGKLVAPLPSKLHPDRSRDYNRRGVDSVWTQGKHGVAHPLGFAHHAAQLRKQTVPPAGPSASHRLPTNALHPLGGSSSCPVSYLHK